VTDLTEALANAFVGLVVSWAATWLVLGYSPALAPPQQEGLPL
jgi:hypothetical protein